MKKLLVFVMLFCVSPVWAARPFVTDDARLTNAKSCQLETWIRAYANSTELWALPACNPTGNLEVTFGTGLSMANHTENASDYVLQAKTLFKTLVTNGWGFGLAAGKVYHPEITPGPNQLGNTYVYVPFSASFYDDQLIMHINAGLLHDQASHQNRMTWGVGTEFKAATRVTGILEIYGDDQSNPYAQTGLRLSIIPNLLQMDATLGKQLDGMRDNQWISFGVRFTPD